MVLISERVAESRVDAAFERIDAAMSAPVEAQRALLEGVPEMRGTVGYTMLDDRAREDVDAAVFRFREMNRKLTLAQEAGDRAAELIIEGQLAALRVRG